MEIVEDDEHRDHTAMSIHRSSVPQVSKVHLLELSVIAATGESMGQPKLEHILYLDAVARRALVS